MPGRRTAGGSRSSTPSRQGGAGSGHGPGWGRCRYPARRPGSASRPPGCARSLTTLVRSPGRRPWCCVGCCSPGAGRHALPSRVRPLRGHDAGPDRVVRTARCVQVARPAGHSGRLRMPAVRGSARCRRRSRLIWDDSAAEPSRILAGAVSRSPMSWTRIILRGRRRARHVRRRPPALTVHRVAAGPVSRGACLGVPLDRGAAWTRTSTARPAGGARLLVSLTDLGAFYVAREVRAGVPGPTRVPGPDAETVLFIDTSGRTSRWPRLPDADLIVQYRRYLCGEPMVLGERTTVERPHRLRLFKRGAWTIRSAQVP